MALVVASLALPMAGCGRRGQLEAPPGASAQAAAPDDDGVQPIGRRPKRVPIKPPHEPFILDPLL